MDYPIIVLDKYYWPYQLAWWVNNINYNSPNTSFTLSKKNIFSFEDVKHQPIESIHCNPDPNFKGLCVQFITVVWCYIHNNQHLRHSKFDIRIGILVQRTDGILVIFPFNINLLKHSIDISFLTLHYWG